MRNIFAIALTCALALLAPSITQAQERAELLKNSTPEERAGIQTKWMQRALSLDDKAAASVAAINLKYAQDNQSLIGSTEPRIEKAMTFRRNSKAKDDELKAVLTPEQYTLYAEKKSEMEEMIRQRLLEKHQAAQPQ